MTAYRNILVAFDGSPTAAKALREAIGVARQYKASLTALCVVSLSVSVADMQMANAALFEMHLQRERQLARAALDRAAGIAHSEGVELRTLRRETRAARASDEILAQAQSGFDLLVMGTHGRRGFDRFFLGSTAEEVLRRVPVPVLLVHADAPA
jgi:nucleotide-binding universal stress UspA family protein